MAGEPIKLELQATKGRQQSLSQPPALSLRVTNVSSTPVWMVGVLPGSSAMRYPRYTVQIEGPSGPVDTRLPEATDYARGLRSEDFVRLAPGESFDPQQGRGFIPIQELAWFKPGEPGTYRFQVRLDTTARDPREWMGHTFVRDRERVEGLLKQVPRVSVASNTLEIQFQ
jgi:hypothetical protein